MKSSYTAFLLLVVILVGSAVCANSLFEEEYRITPPFQVLVSLDQLDQLETLETLAELA